MAGLLSQYDFTRRHNTHCPARYIRPCRFIRIWKNPTFFFVKFFSPHRNICVIINQFDHSLRHGIIWDCVTYFDSLLHLVASVISKLEMQEDMFSPWRSECNSNQCPWWSSSYVTQPDSKKLGFDPSLRHRIFSDRVTYSSLCYIMINLIQRIRWNSFRENSVLTEILDLLYRPTTVESIWFRTKEQFALHRTLH